MEKLAIEKALRICETASTEDAIRFQEGLQARINSADSLGSWESVAGIDLAYDDGVCVCAIVVLERTTLRVLEVAYHSCPVSFPYIPGFLFFREFPAFYGAFLKLQNRPDLLIFDGQGLAHPRRMGIATACGILLDIPTIGCAKSRLAGDHDAVPNERLASVPLHLKGEKVGHVLRSKYVEKKPVKPLYVSSGHRVSPDTALAIVKSLVTVYRLPLPTHLAHKECESFKKTMG